MLQRTRIETPDGQTHYGQEVSRTPGKSDIVTDLFSLGTLGLLPSNSTPAQATVIDEKTGQHFTGIPRS